MILGKNNGILAYLSTVADNMALESEVKLKTNLNSLSSNLKESMLTNRLSLKKQEVNYLTKIKDLAVTEEEQGILSEIYQGV